MGGDPRRWGIFERSLQMSQGAGGPEEPQRNDIQQVLVASLDNVGNIYSTMREETQALSYFSAIPADRRGAGGREPQRNDMQLDVAANLIIW